jgi:PAS domain S-box-containing protein
MPSPKPIPLAELVRKIDEVRALSNLPPLELEQGSESEAALLAAAGSLLGEVERHKRRLIETTVLLGALSELIAAMFTAGDPAPALISLAHFLRGAFRLDWVLVGLVDPGTGCFGGPLVATGKNNETEERSLAIPVPETGPLARVLAGSRADPIQGPDTASVLAVLGTPSATGLHELVLLPIGRGPIASRTGGGPTGEPRPEPVRGCLAVGRLRAEPIDGDHLTLLESLAGSVGVAIENSRLTRRLREAMRFRDHVLESMIDGVVAVDRDRRLLVMNEVAEGLLGLERGAALGESLPADVLKATDAPADPIAEALAPGAAPRRTEGTVGPPGKNPRPVRLGVTPLRDEDGGVVGALVTFVDLSAIREMEQRIRHLDRIAALGRFTSSVAHEIRNPLAGIAAGIEYLGRGIAADDARQSHLGFVTREVRRLDRIVADLLLATRPREPQRQPLKIEVLIQEAMRALENRPEAAETHFVLEVSPELPLALSDPDQLAQILLNLLLNAVQAGGAGEVRVRAELLAGDPAASATPGEPRIQVAIADSGPGIPAEIRERIFEPFFTTKKDGTGLGLYICHEMATRNGGEILARNRAAGGAEFVLTLPMAPRP